MKLTRAGEVALLALLGLGAGGTTLAANNAPAPAPTHVQIGAPVGFTSPKVVAAHPAVAPTPVVSPKVTLAPKVVKATPKPSHKPASSVPAKAVIPTPKSTPRPTPVAVATPVPTPRPTPVPTPSGPISSGTLPPLTFTLDINGTTSTVVGDSISKTVTCPTADTNCISGVTFSVPEWGNYYLKLSWQFAFTTYVGGPSIVWTNQMNGGMTGSGSHSGTGGPVGYSSGGYYKVSMNVEVAWA